MAVTREQVLAAYAANPLAELNPSEEAIQFWQNAGLDSFDQMVREVRAANPDLAARIDAERANASPYTAGQARAPEIEERIIDMGDGVRSEYFIKGTDIRVDAPTYFEDYSTSPLTESSVPTLVAQNTVIYDPQMGGEHIYSPQGDYLGFNEGTRSSGLGSFLKETIQGTAPIWSAALTAGGASGALGSALAPTLSTGAQGALGGALIGGGTAAVTGEDILKGAVVGGASGYLQGANTTPVTTDASLLANDAAQMAAQGLSETQIAEVLGFSGYASTPAANLAASMAVNGLDVGTITQQLDALSSNTGLMSQTLSDATFIAEDASRLATQGLSEPAIKEVLSAPGYVSDSAANLAASMAANGLDATTMAQQLDALSSNTGLMSQTLTDASFIASDASQLAEQGLSQEAIKEVLSAPGYVSDSAAELAASMASNGLDTTTIAQQLDALSNNTGLMSQTGSGADFLAADTLQLQGQVGNNAAAIEQNLVASGVDPLVAADVANQVILDPSITQSELATNISNNFGNNIYDVDMATTYPTSTLPGSGGLLSDLPVTAPTVAPVVSTPAVTPVTPTVTAPATVAPVAPTAPPPTAPAATTPVAGTTASNLLSGLTPTQIANLLTAGVSLAGLSAGVNAVSNQGSSFTPYQAPTQQMPTYTPDYYNQLQQYYNAYMPQTPKDVVTPLQQWYNSSYGA